MGTLFLSCFISVHVYGSPPATNFKAISTDQVEVSGVYRSGGKYWNFGKSGRYQSFGVATFATKKFPAKHAILELHESDYKSTRPGKITIWLVASSSLNGVKYLASKPGGYGSQLGKPILVGAYSFSPSADKSDREDHIPLNSHLSSLMFRAKSGRVSLVFTMKNGFATFAGSGSPTPPLLVFKK